jgi:CMP-N,N'-diacetyllegionaminic acid synthase
MIKNKQVLAIIPARGGSKGLPGKNIMELGGKPLISWTIHAAQKSKYIDRVILSSDDAEICATAGYYGCEVPFTRPEELATDAADSASVVLHALEQMERKDSFDIIVLLQPTSPFRNERHIDEALEQFVDGDALSLVSVNALNKSMEWLFVINQQNHTLQRLGQTGRLATRRQDLPPIYALNGALYLINKEHFMKTQRFIDELTQAYIMESKASVDIDTQEDFDYARFIL